MASEKEMNKWETDIVDGPSKFDLMVALFEARPKMVSLKFSTLPPKIIGPTLRARIFSVKKVDPMMFKEDWEITGFLLGTPITFTAVYSTKTRKGRARLIGY